MEKKIKVSQFHLKAADETTGRITAYASVFGLVDYDGEIVDKGAFKRSIAENGGKVVVLWQHDRRSPIGWGESAKEDDYGLLVTFKVLMDSEQGRHAFDFVRTGLSVGGRPGLSIGFQVEPGGSYVPPGGSVCHFTALKLVEYSIVTFPANAAAIALDAKHTGTTRQTAGDRLIAAALATSITPKRKMLGALVRECEIFALSHPEIFA